MEKKSSYQVKSPDFLSKLCLSVVFICVAVTVFFMMVTPDLHIGLVWAMVVLLIVPFSASALWTKRYCITVKGRTIIVQRGFCLKPFQIDIADITRAVYHMTETRVGVNTKLTVYTVSCGKFSVEMLMDNGGRFMDQIQNTVGKDKIEVVRKSLVKN